MKVATPQGEVDLIQPDRRRLRSLRAALPPGVLAYSSEVNGARYGIVMKCGDTESWAIKQQPPEVPEKTLQAAYMGNSILIALSILRYIEFGFGGCLMPCPYIRKKQAGIEAGIAYFGAPCTTGIEAAEFPFEGAFDNQFGHGFTTMFSHFVKELQRSSDESGITLQPCLGLDYRPRSALEQLGFQFLIHGSGFFCLKTKISEQDPIWTAIRSTGIHRMYHLPSVPAEIAQEQLSIAKPQDDKGENGGAGNADKPRA
jgi:hypothetical protein